MLLYRFDSSSRFSVVFEPQNIEFKIRLKIDESGERFVRTDHIQWLGIIDSEISSSNKCQR